MLERLKKFFRKESKREKFLREYQEARRLVLDPERRIKITSREYELFKEREEGKLNWYERLANLSEKAIKISPDQEMKEDIQKAIDFTGLRITPTSVMSFAVLTIIAFVVVAFSFILVFPSMITAGLVVAVAGVAFAYYLMKYPMNLVKAMRVKASSQVVLAVLYMVVSMRISPNLERALRFSAANVSGELAWDMRRLLWDIEMGRYTSANEALTDYIVKWKPENEEFAEALRLIRDSRLQTPQKAEETLDEALNVILDGTRTRMKHYSQDLKLPVMIVHMMGIVLPVLGTIMAPLAAVFLADVVKPHYFIIGYNVALPLFIIWFINNILQKRPITFSEIDTSGHPELPKKGSFMLKRGKMKVSFPVLPIALIVAIVFITPSIYYFSQNPMFLTSGEAIDPSPILTITMSMLITLGIAFTLAVYFLLTNFQRIRVQKDIEKIESEFELALFQLGNRISAGTPVELAIEKSLDDIKDLEIANLFRLSLRNIKTLGMTFEESMFHPKWGALRYYPSKLVNNIMYTVVDTAKKGVRYAADSMLTISKYLRSIRETQEYIRDTLSDTVSSMTFQAYALTPMITGLIVAMSQVIIQVLVFLGSRLQGMGMGDTMSIPTAGLFGDIKAAITPSTFQLIIGIYLVEVIIILAMFLTKITHGENKVVQWHSAGKMLIIGVVMYFLVALSASTIFGGLITSAIQSLAGG